MPYFKEKGFTLIELLVVISIIGILTTIATITFTNLNKNSRDSKRQSDLRNIQAALEQYHADQNYYPLTIPFGASLTNDDGSRNYMSIIPTDPLAGNPSYIYTPSQPNNCDNDPNVNGYCSFYYLCAQMENIPGDTCPEDSARNYKVTPQ